MIWKMQRCEKRMLWKAEDLNIKADQLSNGDTLNWTTIENLPGLSRGSIKIYNDSYVPLIYLKKKNFYVKKS